MSNPVFFSPYMSNPVFFYTQGSGQHRSEDEVSEFLTDIFPDLSIDKEENAELVAFFAEVNPPPVDKLIFTRASAFHVGCDFLRDDRDTKIQLLRCVNVVVHAFEMTCLQ